MKERCQKSRESWGQTVQWGEMAERMSSILIASFLPTRLTDPESPRMNLHSVISG